MINEDVQLILDKSSELLSQATALYESSNYDESARSANEVLELLLPYVDRADLGNERDSSSQKYSLIGHVAHAYNRLNTTSMLLCDYPLALRQAEMSLEFSERTGDDQRKTGLLGNIGTIHNFLSDYPKALEYHIKALSLDEALGNETGAAVHLGNIGNVYVNLTDYPKALEYCVKALSLDEELGNMSGVARHLGNIGRVYEKQQSYQRAQEYYLKALHLSEEIGASWPRLHWLEALGSLYATQKQLSTDANEAEKYLLLAISDSTTLGVKHITRDASERCYFLYKEQERWQEALSMKELHASLKEQINIEEAKKQESIRQHQKEVELAQAAASAKLTATTSLLHRVLPAEIATRMISGEEEIADYFTSVSILFADIAGFTPISADMPAIIVVRFLNYVFAEFDRIIKKYGCEKIKTIGDGYMAVAGAPIECADHAERLAAAALEMQQTITLPESIREYLPDGLKLGVRIGLHTGSVVAGVIGEERFVYDIYSDAVNTAARMESHGEENKVHVSNDFFRHMQNRFAMTKNTTHGFVFEKRAEMEIKGKGMMRTYFLENA